MTTANTTRTPSAMMMPLLEDLAMW
jgi:hypothetical protein